MEERGCPVCASRYLADPKRLKRGRQTTCSRACSYKRRNLQKVRSAHDKPCPVCGHSVLRSASKLKSKHGSVFCSRNCHYKGRSLGLTKRIVTKPYTYTPEGKAALLAASRKPKGKRRHHYLTCLNCLKVFDDLNRGRKRRSGMIFCSLSCCNAYRKGASNPSWRGGHPEYYGPDWRKVRREVRERDGHMCLRCGAATQKWPDVHHIVPVSSFENPNDAHFLDNVVSLCHPCHMFVEWRGIDFLDGMKEGI